MYEKLYEIWKQETEKKELGRLPVDFYIIISEYVKRLNEESRMIDKKSLKALLLKKETKNVKKMVDSIVSIRYKKVLMSVCLGKSISPTLLTSEEKRIFSKYLNLEEELANFLDSLLYARDVKSAVGQNERVILRFLKDTPAIIGIDLKTYGPFKIDDVGSLPAKNAKILVRQGFAKTIMIS